MSQSYEFNSYDVAPASRAVIERESPPTELSSAAGESLTPKDYQMWPPAPWPELPNFDSIDARVLHQARSDAIRHELTWRHAHAIAKSEAAAELSQRTTSRNASERDMVASIIAGETNGKAALAWGAVVGWGHVILALRNMSVPGAKADKSTNSDPTDCGVRGDDGCSWYSREPYNPCDYHAISN